jgi:hypothetical protein
MPATQDTLRPKIWSSLHSVGQPNSSPFSGTHIPIILRISSEPPSAEPTRKVVERREREGGWKEGRKERKERKEKDE